MKFYNKHSKIIDLLNQKLILPGSNSLSSVYLDFEEYCNNKIKKNEIKTARIEDFREPFKSYLEARRIASAGIDLPAFLSSDGESKASIMVCAMDPLTAEPTQPTVNTKVGLGIPFDLMELSRVNHTKFSGSLSANKNFFEQLLTLYNIYITDIYKLFFRELLSDNRYKKSNAIGSYKKLSIDKKDKSDLSIHAEILLEEIKIVNPSVIITLGNASRNTLVKINNLVNGQKDVIKNWELNDSNQSVRVQEYRWKGETDIPIFSLPHISNSANGIKSKILQYYGYPANEGSKHMASIVMELIAQRN